MKRPAILLLACLAGLFGALVVGASMVGLVPMLGDKDSGRPPCEQLPSTQAVAAALEHHADRMSHIEDLGDGISVQVATPCEDADLALVSIRYHTDDERSRVHNYLRDNDGFGVPVELVKGR